MSLIALLLALLTGCPPTALPSQPVHGHVMMLDVICEYDMLTLARLRFQ